MRFRFRRLATSVTYFSSACRCGGFAGSTSFSFSSTRPTNNLSDRTFEKLCQLSADPKTHPASFSSSSKLMASLIQPPCPRREEEAVTLFGDVKEWKTNGADKSKLLAPPRAVPNPYGWMRSDKRDDKDVLEHLKKENEYTKATTDHLESLRSTIYEEMLSKVTETDFTAPTPLGEFVYYSRTFQGKSYSVRCRAPRNANLLQTGAVDASKPVMEGEVVFLDENKLAEGHDYCSVGQAKVSPNGKLLAYTLDLVGGETYDIIVVDISSGEKLDEVKEVDSPVLWGDDKTLFYNKMDEQHRPWQTYRHTLSSDSANDVKLFEEPDELFWLGISKSQDGKFLFIESSSKETSEVLFVDLGNVNSEAQPVAKRRKKVLYDVEHRDGIWYISTNVGGTTNFHLVSCEAKAESENDWEPVVDRNGERLFNGETRVFDGIMALKSHGVCFGREGGIPQIWCIKFNGKDIASFDRLQFEEDVYDVGGVRNHEYDTSNLFLYYESLTTPTKTIKLDLNAVVSETREVIKAKVVPGYDASLYASERITVKSRDGKTEIPCSIVYRRDLRDESKPQHLHLYGYGSYGSCIEADFRSTRLALLDRGVIFVIAHVRGGGELGRGWYEMPNGAKYGCKKNTFYDFVDAAKHLIDKKMTEPEKLSIEGRSAGGLLIGASVNLAPELFRCAIYGVPFVDVAVTMCDCSIPLTVVEWEEWGNPNEKEFFNYMLSYSPMDNVKAGGDYPACLLTGGLHDPRVAYWEPMKMAAEIRHKAKENANKPILLKIDMSAGHFSASDRYKYLKELSFDYAFLIDQLGLLNE